MAQKTKTFTLQEIEKAIYHTMLNLHDGKDTSVQMERMLKMQTEIALSEFKIKLLTDKYFTNGNK